MRLGEYLNMELQRVGPQYSLVNVKEQYIKLDLACGLSTNSEILEVHRSNYTADYYSEVMKPMGYEPVVTYMQDNTPTIS